MLKIGTDILWSIAIVFLIGGGLYFTVVLKGPQFHLKPIFTKRKKKAKSGVSPFESLMMALAARVGVGSLAGIALAISIGGPGTIFWIWVAGIITAVNTYAESTMAAKYQKETENLWEGGPSYYIKQGLNNSFLSKVYALLLIAAYILGFITIQSNTITKVIVGTSSFSGQWIGLLLCGITGYIIFKGVKQIANITGKLVPVMGIGYFLICLSILIMNSEKLPMILIEILKTAFRPKTVGVGFLSTFLIGIQRGVFSTEAGLGSGAIASSTTKTEEPSDSGLIQVIGIYLTVFVICTMTAFVILSSDYENHLWQNMNGIELTEYALTYHLGGLGKIFLLFSILTFAYSTIISGYYYGESSLKFLLRKQKSHPVVFLKIGTLLLILIGSMANPTFLWNCVDIFVALLAIINMYSLFCLRKNIKSEWESYRKKKKI